MFRDSVLQFHVFDLGFRIFGVRVSVFGFRVSSFWFRVSGFGFGVSGFGFRIWRVDLSGGHVLVELCLRSPHQRPVEVLFRISGSDFGFRISGSDFGFGFRVRISGSDFVFLRFGFRVLSSWFRVSGSSFGGEGFGPAHTR